MNRVNSRVSTLVAFSMVLLYGKAQGVQLTILDNAADDTVQLTRDGQAVGIVNQETITYTDPLFGLHPAQTAFARVQLLEPSSTVLSDTLDFSLAPNNDGKTSTLTLTFNSDKEGQVLPGLQGNPAPVSVDELMSGNKLVDVSAACPATGCRTQMGLVDSAGNPFDANKIIGEPSLTVTVTSDSEVPEPSTSLLVVGGLLAVGVSNHFAGRHVTRS
jgi:hypothetical protein